MDQAERRLHERSGREVDARLDKLGGSLDRSRSVRGSHPRGNQVHEDRIVKISGAHVD